MMVGMNVGFQRKMESKWVCMLIYEEKTIKMGFFCHKINANI